MRLDQLRYFVAVAEELHFRRAAERLHVSQPPLSFQIKALEEELGTDLFIRTKRQVELTEAGRALLQKARRILELVRDTREEIRSYRSGQAGSLSVGFTLASSFQPLFYNSIFNYRQQYPLVAVRLQEMVSERQVDALMEEKLDAGFIRGSFDKVPGLELIALLEEPLYVAMHPDHPLAVASEVSLSSLRREPFVNYPANAGVGIYRQVISLCDRAGFEPRVVQEVREPSLAVGLVASGMGVAILPAPLRNLNVPGVIFRRISDPKATTTLYFVHREVDDNSRLLALKHCVSDLFGLTLASDGARNPS